MGEKNVSIRRLEAAAGKCRDNLHAAYFNPYSPNCARPNLPASAEEDVYHMSDAILADPIKPENTPDLGLSQAHRLHHFLSQQKGETPETPDLSGHMAELDELGVPIVGAEFHLSEDQEIKGLERNLFVLNMAQYQPCSKIPMSKDDEGLMEVRMNPSYFPVTIANWELMKNLLPLDETSFFLPITPVPKSNRELNDIKSLLNIVYASHYEVEAERRFTPSQKTLERILIGLVGAGAGGAVSIITGLVVGVDTPPNHMFTSGWTALFASMTGTAILAHTTRINGEPAIGEHYFGLTQTLKNGEYTLHNILRDVNGRVPSADQHKYQLNLYPGYGKVFPEQAYYASMAYTAPEILDTVRKRTGTVGLKKASEMKPEKMRSILDEVNDQILENPTSRRATEIGQEIRDAFSLAT
ncbi:MAG: hypothetical protein Q8P81_04400 [Nanoarchaeota archaeon]|nr:hypothetical protein [Nanoarchaeota archaeon]